MHQWIIQQRMSREMFLNANIYSYFIKMVQRV